MEFNLQEELKKLPDRPGVYLMHDAADQIIYVGKAKVLKNRVRQYFHKSGNKSAKVLKMVSQIAWFETIVVDSEAEALVLECNLIKENRPKYNTMLMDDKGYPYIRVTVDEDFPRIQYAHHIRRDNARYYGPYTNAGAVKDTIRLTHRLFRIRSCSRKLPEEIGKERPCLNYHIHQCDAPCQGYISKEKYAEAVRQAQDFLEGNYGIIEDRLRAQMKEYSDAMDYEQAAACRDLLFSVQKMEERQKMVETTRENRDMIALATDGEDAVVQVFFVREGKLISRDSHHLRVGEGSTRPEIIEDFVKQFYAGTPFLPHEIFVEEAISDAAAIEEWLSAKSGHQVKIVVPQRGKKVRLLELARQNAEMILSRDREKLRRQEARTRGAVHELEQLLDLSGVERMEAYDISNTMGFDSVGSMVVYEQGEPKRNDYRKFRIRGVSGPDDYASMEEVLTRRFTHGLNERETLRERGIEDEYGKFTRFPDLILMDGGKGQVNVAESVLSRLNLSIPVCGMVKDDNHRTRGLYFHGEEVPIDKGSEAFLLITRIQDEAHRFAITFHRNLRSKDQVHSILDDIDGIGPARRKALMRQFLTIDAIRSAGVDELAAPPEMNRAAAKRVYAFFHEGEIPD